MNSPDPKFLLGKILRHMQESVLMTDDSDTVIYVNRQFCRLTGYKRKDILGKSEFHFWSPQSAEKVRHELREKRDKGKSSVYEAMLRTKKGIDIPVFVSGTPMPGGGSLGIYMDLRTMRERESLYRQLVENMNEAVWRLDKNDRTIYVNKKYCEMAGYSLEEMKGKSSQRFFDRESVRRIRVINRTDRKDGKSSSYEATLINRQGKRIPMLISGTPLADGGTMGMMTDLTEVKHKESMYRILIENIREAVYMTDAHWHPVYANPAFFRLTGYAREDLCKLEERDLWDIPTGRHVKKVNTEHRRHGISSNYEGIMMTKAGKRIPVFVRGTPLPDGGTIGIVTDLSEIRKEETRYRHLVEQMNEVVWILDEDFRTTYVNPRFSSLAGYSMEEVKGRRVNEFFDAESQKHIRWAQQHERKKGISSSYTATLIGKNGAHIPVLISGSPQPDEGTVCVITDLTEIRKREMRERILSDAMAYSGDAMIVIGPTRRIETWNKGAKIIFGYRAEEMIGKTLDKVFAREDIEHLLDGKRVHYNFELRGKHKNRHPVAISATSTAVRPDNDLKNSFHLLIARDISSQLKYDEELSLKYQKLRDAYNEFGSVRRQMDYMFELTDLCVAASSAKSLGAFIVSAIIMLTKVDACLLQIYRPTNGILEYLSSFGLPDEWSGRTMVPLDKSLVKQAFKQGGSVKIVDLLNQRGYHPKRLARKSNLVSALVIPLMSGSELIGGLTLYVGPEKKLEIFENEFIERFCKLVSIALSTVKG